MLYYKPVLPDGKKVPLPWQIKIFYLIITWPLRDDPSSFAKIFGCFSVAFGFIIFLLVDEGEILFIVDNFDDMNLSIEALVTCVVLNECILRIFNMAFTKEKFKEFLKKFFLNIYVDEKTSSASWKQIRQGLIPATVYSYTYILTMISFQIVPFLNFAQNQRSLPYKMSLHYDLNKPLLYGFTLLYLYWTGSTVTFFLIGEAFLLASFILHLNARYTILQQDILHCSEKLIWTVPKSRVAFVFRKKLAEMNERNCKLDEFSVLLEKTYSFRIFVMIAFSAGLLCVLSVQVASLGLSSTKNIGYVFWMVAKISELLLFGTLGSTLIQTTDRMSLAYYQSNWEQVIYRSRNTKENVLLMKDLQIIMSLHRNPKRLTGYGFFDVSLDTVVMVLRCAFSYFTCLYTIKQSKE